MSEKMKYKTKQREEVLTYLKTVPGQHVTVADIVRYMRDKGSSVGTTTLTSMIHAGATGIVIEAGRTLLVDRKRTLAMADEKGITIVSMSESELV